MCWAFLDARAGGINAADWSDTSVFKFIDVGRQFHRRDIDSLAQIIGRHVPNKPARFLGVDNGVFALTTAQLIRSKHDHWRVKGQILPLAIGCQIDHSLG